MTTRWIADLHFFHGNVIQFENRPFKDVNTMNKGIISSWNNTVLSDDDDTWIIGDIAFNKHCDQVAKLVQQLRGRKHLVLGNHDDLYRAWTWHKIGFTSVHTIANINVEGDNIWMAHHQDARKRYGLTECPVLFHGHEHARGQTITYGEQGWNVNVGYDCWGRPITIEEIRNGIKEELRKRDKIFNKYKGDKVWIS